MANSRADAEIRILILAPTGRDARLLASTLSGAKMPSVICSDLGDFLAQLQDGAGAGLIAQEGLSRQGVERISSWLATQPPWSDMPFVVLTSGGRPSRITMDQALELEALLTLIERPVRPDTILSSLRAALRARKRQYEMRHHQEKLTRANRDLEQFAHSASHDLQEPLRAVAIYSELLAARSAKALDDQSMVYLEYLQSGAKRMEMLVRDLLMYTRTAGLEENVTDAIDAGEHLEIALANLAHALENTGAEITHDQLPLVKIRASHLQELFQNLIGNAIKYRRDEPPRVHVSARPDGGHWRLAVSDNGLGIEKQFHEQIFGIFKRLHTTDRFPGTGIGLAICQRIAERYGGRIWVESELGKGSTFYVTVPV